MCAYQQLAKQADLRSIEAFLAFYSLKVYALTLHPDLKIFTRPHQF